MKFYLYLRKGYADVESYLFKSTNSPSDAHISDYDSDTVVLERKEVIPVEIKLYRTKDVTPFYLEDNVLKPLLTAIKDNRKNYRNIRLVSREPEIGDNVFTEEYPEKIFHCEDLDYKYYALYYTTDPEDNTDFFTSFHELDLVINCYNSFIYDDKNLPF